MRTNRDLVRALVKRRKLGPVARRWGVVVGSGAGATLTVEVDGVSIPGVPRWDHVTGLVDGDMVALDVVEGDLVVAGRLA